MPKAEQLVAHRGFAAHYPENSIIGIEAALAAGALYVELDIQLSEDKVPFIYHDADLQRVSDEQGLVMEMTSSELADYNAEEKDRFGQRFDNTPISPLADLLSVIQANPQAQFFIELKTESIDCFGSDTCLEKISDHLEQQLQQCILISFNEQAVLQAREYGFEKTGVVSRDWDGRNALIQQCQADYFFINHKRLPSEGPIEANCPVVLYEIIDRALGNQLLARGASKIETFDIAAMLEQ